MTSLPPLARLRRSEADCRFCLWAGLALLAAIGALTYGYLAGDVVTALGGLLFVPAAVLLAGIGMRGGIRNGGNSP
jgi:hypothetical protein